MELPESAFGFVSFVSLLNVWSRVADQTPGSHVLECCLRRDRHAHRINCRQNPCIFLRAIYHPTLLFYLLSQRNIKPMTRPERRALKDKVALEKGRLMQVSQSRIPSDYIFCCRSYIRVRTCPHTYNICAVYISVGQTLMIQSHNGVTTLGAK